MAFGSSRCCAGIVAFGARGTQAGLGHEYPCGIMISLVARANIKAPPSAVATEKASETVSAELDTVILVTAASQGDLKPRSLHTVTSNTSDHAKHHDFLQV